MHIAYSKRTGHSMARFGAHRGVGRGLRGALPCPALTRYELSQRTSTRSHDMRLFHPLLLTVLLPLALLFAYLAGRAEHHADALQQQVQTLRAENVRLQELPSLRQALDEATADVKTLTQENQICAEAKTALENELQQLAAKATQELETEQELTETLQAAVANATAERDSLREELAAAQKEIQSLKQAPDKTDGKSVSAPERGAVAEEAAESSPENLAPSSAPEALVPPDATFE